MTAQVISFRRPVRASAGEDAVDAAIRKQVTDLGLAEGFLRRCRCPRTPRLREIATVWAEAMPASIFFRVIAFVDPSWSSVLHQILERAERAEVEAEQEARRSLLS